MNLRGLARGRSVGKRLGAVLLLGLLVPGGLGAEHQRVAATKKEDHRWQTGLGLSLTPAGPAAWDLGLSPRLSYEYARTWELSASWPFFWAAKPEAAGGQGRWGSLSASLAWKGGPADFRWRAGAGWAAEVGSRTDPGPARVSADLGLAVVRDPAILGLGLSVTAPLPGTLARRFPPGWSGALDLSFQEVVNDNLVWSLSLTPRVSWSEGSRGRGFDRVPSWSVGVSWGLGWYEEPWSLTASASAESGVPWTLGASGSRSW